MAAIFLPSYTHPPGHYLALHQHVLESTLPGRANTNQEMVFIATSIYDQKDNLIVGPWGQAVIDLINIIGPQNVFLSIFYDNPRSLDNAAVENFSSLVNCNTSIVLKELSTPFSPHHKIGQRQEYTEYVAGIRNRALEPLTDPGSPAYPVHFDKLLFIDDILFDPVDAANLLFSTNLDHTTGKTRYKATCATDFINPFKFSDIHSTRDAEGHAIRFPFFPWFSNHGRGESREDVLDQRDAVRVKSCWGGMVAFEGKWFQPDGLDKDLAVADLIISHDATNTLTNTATVTVDVATSTFTTSVFPKSTTSTTALLNLDPAKRSRIRSDQEGLFDREAIQFQKTKPPTVTSVIGAREMLPLRFRGKSDVLSKASTGCLIMSDLADGIYSLPRDSDFIDTGIYLNAYIRVAHTYRTFRYLHLTRRFERLYAPLHFFLSSFSRPSARLHGPEIIKQESRQGMMDLDFAERNDTQRDDKRLTKSLESTMRRGMTEDFCRVRD